MFCSRLGGAIRQVETKASGAIERSSNRALDLLENKSFSFVLGNQRHIYIHTFNLIYKLVSIK